MIGNGTEQKQEVRMLETKNHRQEIFKMRPRLQRKEASSVSFYEQLFPLIHEKIGLINSRGIFHYANLSLCELLEAPYPPGLIGQWIGDYLQSGFGVEFEAMIDLMKLAGRPIGPIQMEFLSKVGNIISCRVKLTPFEWEGLNLTHLAIEDITELKASQVELLMARFEVENSYSSIISGWAKTLELRDLETQGHCDRVTETMVRLALKMGFQLEETVQFRHGAMLHDIGKVGIPDSILLKPGPLTVDEWNVMKMHPVYAYELLKHIQYLQPALAIPYSHHEKWDGSGYPFGLSREQIPIEARMFSVVDVWDALTNPRPYRQAWNSEQVVSYIQEGAGSQFDPDVVSAFRNIA
jgi:HD-GYP domain-containing protein (c-di-GMP phosphodiesterase class II)